MAYYIFAQDGSGSVAFDLLASETHGETCVASEHNVEDGSPITDHVIIESSVLSLSLGVTQTPTDKDPDEFRGSPQLVSLFTPTWQAPFDASPGAFFRGIEVGIGGPKAQDTSIEVLGFFPHFNRITETEQKLLAFKNGAKLLSISGLTRTYDDMVMERCELQLDKPGLAMFAIDLRQIRLVKTASVAAPQPLEPRGSPMKQGGQQAPTPLGEEVAKHKASILHGILY